MLLKKCLLSAQTCIFVMPLRYNDILGLVACKQHTLQLCFDVLTGGIFYVGNSSFSWAGSGSPLFTKTAGKKPPADDDVNDAAAGADESTDNEEAEDEGDNIHFEPIVQLPDYIDVKTGEEDEEEMFRQRAKLYRWDGVEWKERGVGDMKILKSNITGSDYNRRF